MSSKFLPLLLTSGGDRRISVPKGGNTNMYGASPFPRSTLGYSSSTANDISLDAFCHLEALAKEQPNGGFVDARAYNRALEAIRGRIRAIWEIDAATDVVFAPSGTDLEYVALSLALARGKRPVVNIVLGQDEVGSGCVLAAAGRYFAAQTAICGVTRKGDPVSGLENTATVNIPVRDETGAPLTSVQIAQEFEAVLTHQAYRHCQVLAHVVHGSKTGLILPEMPEIDALQARYGDRLSFVVDACQARIEGDQIHQYLGRQAIVLLTGSKFVGGPPFSGLALVPAAYRPVFPLASGLATIFRRAEWPVDWPAACDHLPRGANPGLWLRLEAALFELERFAAIDLVTRSRIIAQFGDAIRALAARLGVGLVRPALESRALHQATLATLDLSALPNRPDIAVAQRWSRVLAARGLRLGQPVKCVPYADGSWAGTLRISLSMPLIAAFSRLDEAELSAQLDADMAQIAAVLEAAQRPVVA